MNRYEENANTHSAHLLIYAIGTNGQLVFVDDVPNGKQCGCVCPACNEPLVAK